jgi:hypothetical protein
MTPDSVLDVRLNDQTTLCFASLSRAQEILGTSDRFVRRTGAFERAARMKSTRPVEEDEFLRFAAGQARAWEPDEIRKLVRSLAPLIPRLQAHPLALPKTVWVVKTSGEEEGGSAYTRENAVMLPPRKLEYSVEQLEPFLAHELFHVFTRFYPDKRDRLYEAIGFQRCGEVALPKGIKSRKLTNPDVPGNLHCIHVQYKGQPVAVMPVVYLAGSLNEISAPERSFFDVVRFHWMVVEGSGERWSPVERADGPLFLELDALTGFFEQVGVNTRATEHPEEILASNFALLAMDEPDAPSPDVFRRMATVL